MTPARILGSATAIEGCFLAAALAGLGVGGAWSPGLDLINCGAPLIVVMAGVGALLAGRLLEHGPFRNLCLSLALLAMIFDLGLIAPEAISAMSQPGNGQGQPYHLVTANAFRANNRAYHAARDIIARGADAVLIQESDGTIAQADWIFARTYPYSSLCPRAGVKLWTKSPILAQGCGLPLPPGSPAVWGEDFVWVRTLGPGGTVITLASVHLPHPVPSDRQTVELKAVTKVLASLAPSDLILAGDFNTPPWTFTMHRQDQALRPLRRRTVFQASWPAQINLVAKPWPAPLLPIDHVYAGSGWSGGRIGRFRVTGSDHLAMDAVLNKAR
jgi:endonuclease/exonuclease/phosphatase (EEP) superfamily protein YafD